MAIEQSPIQNFILEQYDDEDEEDAFCKNLMQALADGSRPPSLIATELDTWVVGESTRRLQELTKRPELLERDTEGNISRRNTPNASGYVDHFFQSFPHLCSVFPPYHAGQTRVIDFLDTLVGMPHHEVPNFFPKDGVPSLNNVNSMTLWAEKGYAAGFLRVGADAIRHPGAAIDTPGSEAEARWRNYQSALVRITLTGFIDCGFISGLQDILPYSSKASCPTSRIRSVSKPEKIGGYILGAAEWVLRPAEARYVYEQCKMREEVKKEDPHNPWSLENWRIWRTQFEYAAGEGRVDLKAREEARLAAQRMIQIEEEDKSA